MSIDPESLQRAMRDLNDIRRAIDRADRTKSPTLSSGGIRLRRILHIAMVPPLIALIGAELYLNPQGFDSLIVTNYDVRLRFLTIAAIAGTICMAVFALYFLVLRGARAANENFEDYVVRNFHYLRGTAFASDLYVKFCAFSLIILAGRPDWVAPLSIVFIGDYLLQGRFFVLPTRTSIALGSICVAFGTYQCIFLPGTLLYPFIAALIVTIASLLYLTRLGKNQEAHEGE